MLTFYITGILRIDLVAVTGREVIHSAQDRKLSLRSQKRVVASGLWL